MSWLLFAALVAAVAAILAALAALLVAREPWELEETPERFRSVRRAYEKTLRTLKDIEFDRQGGTLSEEEGGRLSQEYKRQAVTIRKALDRSRMAAVRAIARGESTALSAEERETIEDLVDRKKIALIDGLSTVGAGRSRQGAQGT
jgi:hypothetical protein